VYDLCKKKLKMVVNGKSDFHEKRLNSCIKGEIGLFGWQTSNLSVGGSNPPGCVSLSSLHVPPFLYPRPKKNNN